MDNNQQNNNSNPTIRDSLINMFGKGDGTTPAASTGATDPNQAVVPPMPSTPPSPLPSAPVMPTPDPVVPVSTPTPEPSVPTSPVMPPVVDPVVPSMPEPSVPVQPTPPIVPTTSEPTPPMPAPEPPPVVTPTETPAVAPVEAPQPEAGQPLAETTQAVDALSDDMKDSILDKTLKRVAEVMTEEDLVEFEKVDQADTTGNAGKYFLMTRVPRFEEILKEELKLAQKQHQSSQSA